MKIIPLTVYGTAALLALLCGLVYPAAKVWSSLAAGSCGLHLALALVVALRPLLDASEIAMVLAGFGRGAGGRAAAALRFGPGRRVVLGSGGAGGFHGAGHAGVGAGVEARRCGGCAVGLEPPL